MQRHLSRYIPTIIGALIFMIYAFYDGYPIVTQDSGTYIGSGFALDVPPDRPIFYGLFLRASSLGLSLWLTIFWQCLLLSWLLIKFIKARLEGIPCAHLFLILALSSVATIGGWHASQLMPDVFTAILCFAIANFLFNDEPGLRPVYLGIAFAATIMHNSHLIIIVIFSVAALVMVLVKKKAEHKRGVIALVAVSVLSWLTMSGANYTGKRGFTPSSSSHVFLMGKMAESGVLKTYLDNHCHAKPYKICAYKDSMPAAAWDFVWDWSSPLYKTGGWDENKAEYNAILKDMLSRPKYLALTGYKSTEATGRQLTLLSIDGTYGLPWMKWLEGTTPFENIQKYFPHELTEYKTSRQNAKTFNLPFINEWLAIVFILSSLIALAVNVRNRELWTVYGFVLAFVIINAFTTAAFANVLGRLNTRVIWLIPFMNILCIYQFLAAKFSVNRQTTITGQQ